MEIPGVLKRTGQEFVLGAVQAWRQSDSLSRRQVGWGVSKAVLAAVIT